MRLPGGQLQNIGYQVNRDSTGYLVNIFYNKSAPSPKPQQPGNQFNPQPVTSLFKDKENYQEPLIRNPRIINEPPPPNSKADTVTFFKQIPVVLRPTQKQKDPVQRQKRKFVQGRDGRFDIYAYHKNATKNDNNSTSELPTTLSKTFDLKLKPLVTTISDKNNTDGMHFEEVKNYSIVNTTLSSDREEENLVIVEGITANDDLYAEDDSSFGESISHESIIDPLHLVFDTDKNLDTALISNSVIGLKNDNNGSDIEPIYYNPDRETGYTTEAEDGITTILYVTDDMMTTTDKNKLDYTNSESFRNASLLELYQAVNETELPSLPQYVPPLEEDLAVYTPSNKINMPSLPQYVPTPEEYLAVFPPSNESTYANAQPTYQSIGSQPQQGTGNYSSSFNNNQSGFIDKSAQIKIAELDPASIDDEEEVTTISVLEETTFDSNKVLENEIGKDLKDKERREIESLPKAQPIVSQLSYSYGHPGHPYYYSNPNPLVEEQPYLLQQPNSANYGQQSPSSGNYGQQSPISVNYRQQSPSNEPYNQLSQSTENYGQQPLSSANYDHQSQSTENFGQQPLSSDNYGQFHEFQPEPVLSGNNNIKDYDSNNEIEDVREASTFDSFDNEAVESTRKGITIVSLDHQLEENESQESDEKTDLENGITIWQTVQLGTMKPIVLSLLSSTEKKHFNETESNERAGRLAKGDGDVHIRPAFLDNNNNIVEEVADEIFLKDINDIVDNIFDETEEDANGYIAYNDPKEQISATDRNDPAEVTWSEKSLITPEQNIRIEKDVSSSYIPQGNSITTDKILQSPTPFSPLSSAATQLTTAATPIPRLTYSLSSAKFEPITTTLAPKKQSIVVKNLPIFSKPVSVIEYKPLNLRPVQVTTGRYPTVKKLPNYPVQQLGQHRGGAVRSFRLPPIFYGGWQPIG